MDPRDPRFNFRSRYDFSSTPRSIPHHLLPPPPPPPVAPSNYYSHPQFHPPPQPPPQFHHYHEDSRRFLTYPDSLHRDSRVYSLNGIDRRETRVFNERMTPDPTQLDWRRDREREGIRKDGFLEEEYRVSVRKNEYLEENSESFRSRVREYGNTVDDYHRVNGGEQEKRDYFGNIGQKKWDNNGDGYFGKGKSQTIESEWNLPKKLEQKTSALGRLQSGNSVWNRIKENAKSLQELKEPNVDLKLNSKKKFMSRQMKRTSNGRDRVIIQVSSRDPIDYTRNNSISSEMKAKETVSSETHICNSSEMKAIGSSSMPINKGSVIEPGSSGAALSNDLKANLIDMPSTVKSNGLKRKADNASSKQPTSLIKKTTASAEVNVGIKMANVSSSKPVAKEVVKNLKAVKKVGAVKTKVGSQAIKACESKPNNVMLVSNEENGDNRDTEQSNKDSDSIISIHVPMDVESSIVDRSEVSIEEIKVNEGKTAIVMLESTAKCDDDSVAPQPDKDVSASIPVRSQVSNEEIKVNEGKSAMITLESTVKCDVDSVELQSDKDITSVHVPMDATAIPVNSVVEDSSKNANMEHGDSIIPEIQSSTRGPTLSDKSLIEISLLETKTTEKSCFDANLVQGNDADDSLKELMKFVEVAHNSDDSDAKIIIDVSSDSSSSSYSSTSSTCSSDESSSTVSPCQAAFPVERNDDLCNKVVDVVSTGSSLNMTSASKLVDDSHIVNQHSHMDDNVNIIGNVIVDNHSLVAPLVEDELEEEDKNKHENNYDLHIDVCTFDDEISPICFPGNEDPSTHIAFPANEDTSSQIAEDSTVDLTMQEISKQLIHIDPAEQNSADIPEAHDVLNCVTNQQNENGGKEDSIKNVSFMCSKKLSKNVAEMGTKKKKQTGIHMDLTGSTKPTPNSRTPKGLPNQSGSAGVKANSYLTRNTKNKTWRRTDNPTTVSPVIQNLQIKVGVNKHPMKKQSPKKFTKGFNSSYVRKGNSLIRKPTNNVAHHPILPFGVSEPKNKSDIQKDSHDTRKESLDIQKESLVTQKESIDIQTEYSVPILEHPTLQSKTEAVKSPISMDTDNTIKSDLLNRKRMVYVKNKSNQLVAASTEKNEKPSFSSLTSDIYYMRNRNQLIRNASSSEKQPKQNEISGMDNSKCNHQAILNNAGISSRTGPLKKRVEKVQRKIHKHAKLSRVWTPNGQADNKILPYIFPWKRTTYRRNLMSKNILNPSRRSISSISRKLQHTRKRDTIYTVSNDGFSLRKSRVVSVGRPNLKWSKSIDKDSKKANEEATLAVAEAERNRRERKRKRSSNIRKKEISLTQGSNPDIELQPGERVFRFGSIRYKMDASQHTLVRIGDEQSSDQHSKKATFVPRRLLIGNNEYIRKGNGNQLVRDPKKLVRMLASEKIRWSIHTARKRLAKKQQYCQFFTRFGKCNKISGKCPYIHDPDKVAICTKFLRGSCTNAACKLTHKIIPERMPDCSYYLQGLCTNLNCPYRHVHVNPQASVCDGFLKGFCADGDECHKKHSHVCPMFEATGECPQGSKCKLHHPKTANRSKKRKHSSKTQNTAAISRYFGSNVTEDSEKMPTISSAKCCTDDFADFISLDCDTDVDDGEYIYSKDMHAKELDSDIDVHSDELDSLIKPVRIMNNDG